MTTTRLPANWLYAAATALALALAAPACAQSEAPIPIPALQAGDGYLYELGRLTDRVHVVAQPQPFHLQPLGNVTVIEQADGLVLVDAGGSRGSGERVVELVRRISDKPVKAVILTHWHGDHPLGASAVLKAWPDAEIISTVRTREHLASAAMKAYPRTADAAANQALQSQILGTAVRLQGASARAGLAPEERRGFEQAAREVAHYACDMDGTVLGLPTRTFADRLVLDDAEAPVEALFLGSANTDGDAVVWLPRQRVLVTGDVVVAPFPFGFGSYPADWLQVLDRLRRFDFAYLVPGHGAVQTGQGYLDAMTSLITDTRAQVEPLAKAGESLEAVRAKIDLSAHAERLVGKDGWRLRWFQRYWTEPFVTSAYKEATGQPIAQGE